ncbi:DUF2357 domain-containing protein [uncultured Prevotella sp.]|uniref:DUF2357 domain-containing protein n=1 Tax=uncultured Prevotella sp. TaxID=159272 RepID=UPI002582C4F9|nr:DUF2357 domain-containing protein [uncultured Prevotella sp.]
MQVEKLEIPILGNFGEIKLYVYPATNNAVLFEEEDAVDYGESRWQLQEGCSYEYELVSNNRRTYQFASEDEIVRFSHSPRHPNAGTLKTGIYVGSLSLSIKDIELDCEIAKVNLEIKSVKAEYRTDYRKMLEDITAYYTDLVLMQGSPVTQKLEIDNDTPQQTLYQRYAFVRSIVESSAFQEAINKIVASPVRKWEETIVERNVSNVKRLSRKNMHQIASSRDRIPVFNGDEMGLPHGLNSVPRTLTVAYKRDTLDNQENQFVKFVLRSFSSFCSELRGKKNANDRLKSEIDKTMDVLNGHLSTLFFKQVSMPSQLNLNSPVLQRKEGYREILQAWLIFDLAAKLSWKGGDNVYEAGKRNVAVLYEYWVFFKLLEVISRVFDIDPVSVNKLVKTDADRINLEIQQGKMTMIEGIYDAGNRKFNVRFYYNRTFAHTREDEELYKSGSWTMNMRPDYTLSIWPGEISMEQAEREDIIVHIHFDAKYRVNKIDLGVDEAMNEEQLSEALLKEKKEQDEGIYKRADLLKMHAYKDAIRRTSGAYILYPGTVQRRLKGFHEIIPGLGAFCLTPSNYDEDLITLQVFLLKIVEHMLDRTSQRERMSYYTHNVYNTPSKRIHEQMPEPVGENRDFLPDETWVVLGYVKDVQHLEWIRKTGLYNFRTGTQNGSVRLSRNLVSSRYILLHAKGESIEFVRLADEGPRVFRRSDLLRMGYPPAKDEEKKKDDIYIVYRLEPERTEPEWAQYKWKISNITNRTGNRVAIPEPVKLSELMKKITK